MFNIINCSGAHVKLWDKVSLKKNLVVIGCNFDNIFQPRMEKKQKNICPVTT